MRLSSAPAALLVSCLAFNIASPQQPSHTRPPASKEHPTSLPVTRVSLYKNGIGFFEHTGHVTGDAAVTIDFTTDQLNDVLQSLTALDLNGGRISGAGYNSTTPLDQQLKSLPLALSEDTTAADFYASIRGSRVEVRAPGVSIIGRLLSVEDRTAATPRPSSDNSDATKEGQLHFITVVSDSGEVRTVQLTQQTSVRLLDTALHQDVSRYLQLLADNRSQGLRHLTLEDHGTGTRELQVSYISAVPVWKSTYRILFTDQPISGAPGPDSRTRESTTPGASQTGGPFMPESHPGMSGGTQTTATLQGWAVVDNTVGEDWNNVQLSLIAGRPQSFTQPLSDPIYTNRPQIPIATEQNLAPTTHDSGMGSVNETVAVSANSVSNLPLNGRSQAFLASKAAPHARGVAGMVGMAGGSAGYGMGGPMPAPPPPSYENLAQASIAPQTQTAAFDDFFQYKLSQPITIRKNESALVPILQAKVTADRVTLVCGGNGRVSQPLRALWITNTTGLTLDRGSFSLVENGSFGGEGLLDPIHPNEKRLLSYAADEAVHVSTEAGKDYTQAVDHITAGKGVLILHRAEIRSITYVIHNAAPDARTVVLEQPIDTRFELTSAVKPTETTPTVYRFRVEVPSGGTERLEVSGQHRGTERFELLRSDESQLDLIVRESGNDAQLRAALAPILDARRRVADAQTAVNQTNGQLTALKSDEDRQRANITALATADKTSRDRFVADLNKTEDAIATQQKELATRTAALDSAKADLANRIESLQIDEKI